VQKNYEDPKKAGYTASPKNKGCQPVTHQKWYREEVAEAINQLPFNKRDTMSAISSALSIPKTTINCMYCNDGIIGHQKDTIKPTLFLDSNHFHFHVDKKWFLITQQQHLSYLVAGEEPPKRNVRNKFHKTKVMFLCAVARPRFDSIGTCKKIEMWLFVKKEPALRNSANYTRDTIKTKTSNVTYCAYLEYMLDKVILAIKARLPRDHETKVTINMQHDNAPSHFRNTDPRWLQLVNAEFNWDFKLAEHPA
jgi:hypothetical protein